jgi:cyclohexa-1,5-dienecarbonyl-CoA hydratase
MGVEVELKQDTAAIRLNSAPSNIFDFDLMDQLSEALDQTANVSLLVISSALEHFSFGVDVKIHTPELSEQMLKKFHDVIRKLYNHKGITVSILNGYALGGGMELALVCDFIFAQRDAVVGFPEIRLACFPPVASILLPRKIGAKASNYLYTGRLIHAVAAEEIGIIEGVFADNADELLETIRLHSLSAMSLLKKVLRRTSGFDFDADLSKAEEIYLNELLGISDMSEGISAFIEKRSPRFNQ